jgi:hypothetical protein
VIRPVGRSSPARRHWGGRRSVFEPRGSAPASRLEE